MRNDSFVGISILNYNSADALEITLDSLERMKTDVHFVCSVLDNASVDCEKARRVFSAFQKKCPNIAGEFVASSKNLGFSGGNNVLIRSFLKNERVTHILLANSDLSFTDYSIDRMLEQKADAIGPVTGNAGNTQTIETGLDDLPMSADSLRQINSFAEKRWRIYGNSTTNVPMLVFFCVLLTRALIEDVGELDERFYPGSYEDDDYCLRITKRGYLLTCARGVFVCHWGSKSFSTLAFTMRKQIGDKNRAKFEAKWERPWVSRVADPLTSCQQDAEYLMKQSGCDLTLISQGLATAEKLIINQSAAIQFYQQKIEEKERLLSKNLETQYSGRQDANAEQVYLMTPIRQGIQQVPGRIILKQLWFKIKRRIKLLFGNNKSSSVSGEYLYGFELLFFLEALAQLIERVAFRLSAPLHHWSEVREHRSHSQEQSVTFSRTLEESESIAPQAMALLEQRVLSRECGTVVFLAPYPSDVFLRDGYYKRIRSIDDLFSNHYFRIYIAQFDTAILEPQVVTHGDRVVEILYNVSNEEHLRQIARLANNCAFLYTHSVLRISQKLLDQIHIPKILDVHGSVPEEAHLYGDFAGERIYGEKERYAISVYDTFVCVTDSMRQHLERKYDSKISSTVLPTYDKAVLQYIEQKQEESKRVSTYIAVYSGGTQKWQRMDLILDAIGKCDDLHYLILTPDIGIVEKECSRRRITKKVEIKSVAPEAVAEEYRKCQYGFILRDDIVVNRVACPTKLMEYIAYEIIPIMYTANIGDFVSMGMQYVRYEDFMAGKLPSEDERLDMVRRNMQLARKLSEIYANGERELLEFGRKCMLKIKGFPEQERDEKEAIGLVVGSFDKGGLEQAVFNLYEGYRACGHPAYILCQNNVIGHFASKLENPDHLSVFNSDADALFDFCRKKNIRWLHYHYNTFMIQEARAMGLRTIYSLQNTYTWLSDEEICARAALINSANAVVAGSTFSKDYYCARTGTSKDMVSVIPIGVNTADLDSHALDPAMTRESLGIKPNDITLGFVASFHQVKHQMNMVGALERIIRKNPNIKLMFVANIGHQQYYDAVCNACRTSSARDNIIFVPFIDHSQLGEFLRKTVDIFVLPTIQEGCSNAVIDALYVGKPMLLTDVGNAGDLKHLKSVTVVSRPYSNLLSFRQSDIDSLCMKQYCINTAEIADGILSIAANLQEQNKVAAESAKKYRSICDKRYMSDRYIDIIETM